MCESHVVSEDGIVTQVFLVNVTLCVEELAPCSVGTRQLLMELDASASLVAIWKVCLAVEFMLAVRERARGLKLAHSEKFPVAAEFSFILHFVLFDEGLAFLVVCKLLLGFF